MLISIFLGVFLSHLGNQLNKGPIQVLDPPASLRMVNGGENAVDVVLGALCV